MSICTLNKVEINKEVKVISITNNEASRKLQGLGIIRGCKLRLLKYNKKGTCLISISNTRVAIESNMLKYIFTN